MDNEVRRQGEQIETLWESNSERKAEIAELRTEVAEIRVGVYGIDGRNGLNGRIKGLETKMKEHEEGCSIRKTVSAHLEEHKEKRQEGLKARHLYIGFGLTVALQVLLKLVDRIA